jgi:hypothetical protein
VLEDLCADTPEAERDHQATNRGGVVSALVLIGEDMLAFLPKSLYTLMYPTPLFENMY